METTQFAGFTWPKQEWALPKGRPAARVGKKRYTSGYYQNVPCMAGKGEIGFYWGEGGEESGRLWTLRVAKQHDLSWSANSFSDDMIHGFAMRLPGGRGFLAGWTMGEQMCASLDRHIYDELRDALQAGNDMARDAAEKMRKEDQTYQAEQQIEQARHEVKEAKASTHDLISEIKLQRMNPGATGLTTAEVLRDALCRGLDEIRKARKRIALLEREPWQAVA